MNDIAVKMNKVSFSYIEGLPIIKDIDLEIKKGEFVLITGESGSGKTTLIRCINGLIPYFHEGELTGDIRIFGKSTNEMDIGEMGELVGSVFQDPRSQFFTTNTTEEVAFGVLNMGLGREEVLQRIATSFSDMEIESLKDKSIFNISSGEKQKIAIASCFAMSPDIYVFDEPSANLDIPSTMQLAKAMESLKKQGKTVIVLEHRLYYLRNLFDKCLFLKNGKIEKEFTNTQALNLSIPTLEQMGLRSFDLSKLKPTIKKNINCSVSSHQKSFELNRISFSYKGKKSADNEKIINNLSMTAISGEVIGIIGENGIGKTTLSRICTGLIKETSGLILLDDKIVKPKKRSDHVYFVMQDSDYQLFSDSVLGELQISQKNNFNLCKAEEILKQLNLWEHREDHPASLSRGQKQRLTIANAIMSEAEIIFFDEPTSGLDLKNMQQVISLINQISKKGIIVFVISHDYEFLFYACTRILHLNNKGIETDFQVAKSNTKTLATTMGMKGGFLWDTQISVLED